MAVRWFSEGCCGYGPLYGVWAYVDLGGFGLLGATAGGLVVLAPTLRRESCGHWWCGNCKSAGSSWTAAGAGYYSKPAAGIAVGVRLAAALAFLDKGFLSDGGVCRAG